MSSVPLQRIAGIGRAAAILVALAGVFSVVAVAATRLVVDDADAFLAGELGRTEFVEAVAPYALLSFVQAISLFASAIVVMVWMYRIARNLRTLRRGTTWGPGWAVGGWFLPPFLYVIPFLALREAWRASDPAVPVGGDWRGGRAPSLLTAWFVVFGPVRAALELTRFGDTLGGLGSTEEALAEQITGSMALPAVTAAADLVAAVLFVVAAQRLTGRHRRLIGEGPH